MNRAESKLSWKHTSGQREALMLLLLVAMALFAYWPVQHFGFLDFDDGLYVTDNLTIRSGLTWKNVLWAFRDIHTGSWHPLTWLSLMLDYELYRLHPSGYHWTNLYFHLLNIILLFVLLKRMTGETWRVVFVAGLFALHPINAESVAWVAERKNVLSTFFCFLTLYFYVLYTERRNAKRYCMVAISFLCGLLSKPMLVSLPVLLMLLDYWPLNRLGPGDQRDQCSPGNPASNRWYKPALEKAPLFILSITFSAVTYYTQTKAGAIMSVDKIDIGSRLANAVISYVKYIEKIFFPVDLAAFYPYPVSFTFLPVFMAAFFLLFVTYLAIVLIRKSPFLFVGWSWYLVVLFPVIGVIQAGEQAMADRYAYLPVIGIFIMVVWMAADFMKTVKSGPHIIIIAGLMLSILLIADTRIQAKTWQNSTTLYEHALDAIDDNYLAHNNLAVVLFREGKMSQCREHLLEAIRIKPDYTLAHYNLGLTFYAANRWDDAAVQFKEAIRLNPSYTNAYLALGDAMLKKGDFRGAVARYQEVIARQPHDVDAHNNLGASWMGLGNYNEAMIQFKEALKYGPMKKEAKENLANVLSRIEAVGQRKDPGYSHDADK